MRNREDKIMKIRKKKANRFGLTENGYQLLELVRKANLQDDALSVLAHGMWVWIWYLNQNSTVPITVNFIYQNQPNEPKEDLDKALQELEQRGHIIICDDVITLK